MYVVVINIITFMQIVQKMEIIRILLNIKLTKLKFKKMLNLCVY